MSKLIFEYGFDDRDQEEANAGKYVSHVKVELENRNEYAVIFYGHVRPGEDLEEEIGLGNEFIADPGIVVVPP